jgi:RNA polymerase sigma factor (sigma-70 family)
VPDKNSKKITDPSQFLPALTEEQLDEASTAQTIRISNEHDREDAKQAWMIGAWIAEQRSEEGKAVRAYQWAYADGYVKRELKNKRRFNDKHRLTLDIPIGEKGEETIMDLQASSEETPYEVFEETATSEATIFLLKKGFSVLETREKEVLGARFIEKMTLKQAAPLFNVTCERIRQIEARALRKILLYFQSNTELHETIKNLGFNPQKEERPWSYY